VRESERAVGKLVQRQGERVTRARSSEREEEPQFSMSGA
jgi:hypothetical protein